MADIIDLRNQKKVRVLDKPITVAVTAQGAADATRGYETEEVSREHEALHEETTKEFPETIEWSTLEYEKREYSQKWFVGISSAAVLLIIIGILAQSYFFVTLIVLAFVVLILYTRRPPRMVSFTINHKGVRVGKTLYEFSQIKSFWTFDVSGTKEVSLETGKLLSPYIRIPLGDIDAEEVETILSRHLPKKEHIETVSDQIANGLGF